MKKVGILLSSLLLFACSSDDSGDPGGTEQAVMMNMGDVDMSSMMPATPPPPVPPTPPKPPTNPTPPPPPPNPAVTGTEPECVDAFTRLADCYLTQEKCDPSATQHIDSLGRGLTANCADIAEQAGGLQNFAAALNASTPCDDPLIGSVLTQLDMNEGIRSLCESEPFDSESCGSVCEASVAPCAEGFADPGVATAMADPAQCTGICTAQPELGSIFSCAEEAGTECPAVEECFAGLMAGP